MTKKEIHYADGTSEVVDHTAEEENQLAKDRTKVEEEKTASENERNELATLKASAKSKLIAGDPLTAEEADTIVL